MEPTHFESLYPPDSRFDEIKKILDFVKSGNSAQLISLPGVGRSNILGLLAYNRKTRELHLGLSQKNFHFVMMNFSEIKARNLAEATKYIFLELVESIRDRKIEQYEMVNNIFEESIKSGDELVIFQGLKKTIDYLCMQNELTVIFLLDRFEEYIPMLTPQFFSNLRVLRDRAKYHFSVIFPLNRPLEESVGHDMLSDFYEFIEGNIVYLSVSDPKLLDFRVSYLEKSLGKEIDKKILSEIEILTGGHGKLTRICLEVYFSEDTNKPLPEFLLEKQRVKATLLEIWKSFTPFEQSLIQREKGRESAHFVAIGLIKENEITIPLLQIFAKTQISEAEKIILDEKKNEILKGDVIISHGLTKSEFKLLKFMVLNPEKIIGRDEAINAVWGELSSTVGVTEQALDQLIFRLRKKIEKNPNSPTYIQTIKGRGFEFTP